ncbi:protein kinase [Mycobacterium sp. 1245805.9]|uniref:serine/threonine protein kinase n=1 Tax=Mycobacterium sp. 1245805.9 TaxID=1856862 RepID=UPI0018D305F9|nr:protein kinase [Mycobacterium sp. 1245805.9]
MAGKGPRGHRRRRRREKARVFGDRWEVIRQLGGGAQGTAYLVRDLNATDADAEYVLKVLRGGRAGEPPERRRKRLARFEREIDALDRLDLSPNIPSLVARHVSEAESFFVTPFAGYNLENLPDLAEPQQILQRFRGLVEAAKFANDREVVHRDIKPNNATVRDDGTPCLVDFGICMYDDEVGLTDTWEGFGNRYFAAPECDAGNPEAIGPPSDIYSLGKVLHWMATGRGKMGRETFEEEAFVFADRFARQYFSVIIEHTVCEYPAARWSASELLDFIDWALAKLSEHDAFRAVGLSVLKDNFGPNDSCHEGSSLSARTGYRDPSADYDIAESFFVSEPVVLDRVDLRLARRSGSGRAEISLIKGGFEVPSDDPEDVVEKWTAQLTAPRNALEVTSFPSAPGQILNPQEVYWIKLAVCDDNSDVEWISAPIELMPQLARFADRTRRGEWTPRVSASGPGLAFRVTARPHQSTN